MFVIQFTSFRATRAGVEICFSVRGKNDLAAFLRSVGMIEILIRFKNGEQFLFPLSTKDFGHKRIAGRENFRFFCPGQDVVFFPTPFMQKDAVVLRSPAGIFTSAVSHSFYSFSLADSVIDEIDPDKPRFPWFDKLLKVRAFRAAEAVEIPEVEQVDTPVAILPPRVRAYRSAA